MSSEINELIRAEEAANTAESVSGPESEEYATALEQLAVALKANGKALDAANASAKAKNLRAKLLTKQVPDAINDRMPCPFCSELILKSARLCKHCHSQLNNQKTSTKLGPNQLAKPEPVKAVILLMLFLGGWYYFGVVAVQDNERQKNRLAELKKDEEKYNREHRLLLKEIVCDDVVYCFRNNGVLDVKTDAGTGIIIPGTWSMSSSSNVRLVFSSRGTEEVHNYIVIGDNDHPRLMESSR